MVKAVRRTKQSGVRRVLRADAPAGEVFSEEVPHAKILIRGKQAWASGKRTFQAVWSAQAAVTDAAGWVLAILEAEVQDQGVAGLAPSETSLLAGGCHLLCLHMSLPVWLQSSSSYEYNSPIGLGPTSNLILP